MEDFRVLKGLLAIILVIAGLADGHLNAPLRMKQSAMDPRKLIKHAQARYVAHSSGEHKALMAQETFDAGFWYGLFDVGDARNLSLIIDTGSPEVGINPGRYKPSQASKYLNQSISAQYITALENGCGVANISGQEYSDHVGVAGLISQNQHFFSILKEPAPNNETLTQLPHDGVLGLDNYDGGASGFGKPFFPQLCDQGRVKSCRFGLAFGTNGTGEQIWGEVDSSLFHGNLSRSTVQVEWLLQGTVLADDHALFKNVSIDFDSGTAGIIGPVSDVRKLFRRLGIQTVEVNEVGCKNAVFGYYPCDKPPTLGFQFGDDKAGFNIESSAIEFRNNGNNNCTAFITGIDLQPNPFWIVGQAWFQGKYVDFDVSNNSIGVAELKDKVHPQGKN